MALDNRLNSSDAKIICSVSERATIINFNEAAKIAQATRLSGPPIARLVDSGKIKGEELRAAQEIDEAFMAISGALFIKPLNMERIDGGRGRVDWPARLADTINRYQEWANFWSNRRKQYLDYTLEIVIAAVIDERHVDAIAQDMGFARKRVTQAIIGGLRDYAARAEWIDAGEAARWKAESLLTFTAQHDR